MSGDRDLDQLREEVADLHHKFAKDWERSTETIRLLFNVEIEKLKTSAHYRYRTNELQNIITADKLNTREKRSKNAIRTLWINVFLLALSYIFISNQYIIFTSLVFLISSVSFWSTVYIMQCIGENAGNNLHRLFHEFSQNIVPRYDMFGLKKDDHFLYKIWLRDGIENDFERLDLELKWVKFCKDLLSDIECNIDNSKIHEFSRDQDFYSDPANRFV